MAISSNSVKTVKALIAKNNVASLNVVIKNQFIFAEVVIDNEGEELEYWTLNINHLILGENGCHWNHVLLLKFNYNITYQCLVVSMSGMM